MSWIKLYRQMLMSEFWISEEPFSSRDAFIHVLLSANWKDGKAVYNGQVINVRRGQCLTSIRKLSTTFHWGVHRVYRWIKMMKLLGMIDSENVKSGTLITIVNYEKYQGETGYDYIPTGNTNGNTDGNTNGNTDGNTNDNSIDNTLGNSGGNTNGNTDGNQYKNTRIEEPQKEDIHASVNAREAGSGPEAVPARREEVGAGAAGSDPDQADDDDDDDDDDGIVVHSLEEFHAVWDAIHSQKTTPSTSPESLENNRK